MRLLICSFMLATLFLCATQTDAYADGAFGGLSLDQSGGFAGIRTTTTVDTDGSFTKTVDFRGKKKTSGKLNADRLDALKTAVAEVPWLEIPDDSKSRGADMYRYDLKVKVGGKAYQKTFDDMSMGSFPKSFHKLMGMIRKVGAK